jgi:hypothetical protein
VTKTLKLSCPVVVDGVTLYVNAELEVPVVQYYVLLADLKMLAHDLRAKEK